MNQEFHSYWPKRSGSIGLHEGFKHILTVALLVITKMCGYHGAEDGNWVTTEESKGGFDTMGMFYKWVMVAISYVWKVLKYLCTKI